MSADRNHWGCGHAVPPRRARRARVCVRILVGGIAAGITVLGAACSGARPALTPPVTLSPGAGRTDALPLAPRRSLATTNSIENLVSSIRLVTRNANAGAAAT